MCVWTHQAPTHALCLLQLLQVKVSQQALVPHTVCVSLSKSCARARYRHTLMSVNTDAVKFLYPSAVVPNSTIADAPKPSEVQNAVG